MAKYGGIDIETYLLRWRRAALKAENKWCNKKIYISSQDSVFEIKY